MSDNKTVPSILSDTESAEGHRRVPAEGLASKTFVDLDRREQVGARGLRVSPSTLPLIPLSRMGNSRSIPGFLSAPLDEFEQCSYTMCKRSKR